MRFRRQSLLNFFLLGGTLLLAPLVLAEEGPRSGRWAHEDSSLKPDPRVTWGRLDNGLRYALLPHDGVPGRVNIQLVVLTGSLDEREDELGIAHFTEHMCFRGTKNLRYEDMVGFFHKLGTEFGSDVNAVTTFDYTAYTLDFRDNDPGLIGDGLQLFREFANDVTFDPAIIEKERGVILAEKRTRGGIGSTMGSSSGEVIFQGLQMFNRSPIGTDESIRTVTRQNFMNFYRRGYRPDLMVVVAVGDFDPATMAGMVEARFSDIPRPAEPITPRITGSLDTSRKLRASVFTVSDIGSAQTMVASVAKSPRGGDSRERQIEQARRRFAMSLLENRLQSAIPEAQGGGASYEVLMGHEAAMAYAVVGGDNWQHGLGAVDQVVRSTYERGFNKQEVEPLKRMMLKGAHHMLDQASTADPHLLAQALTDSITSHTVYVGMEEEWKREIEWLEKMDTKQLLESFRAAWDLDRTAFHVAGDVDIEDGPKEVLRVMGNYRKGRNRFVQTQSRRESEFKGKWDKKTEVVESAEIPELAIETMRFGNNVRLNFIHSPHEPGLVHGTVRVGSGLLDMPGDQPALKEFGLQVLMASGTTHLNTENLGRVIQDHMLDFSLDVEDHDAFTFRGLTGTEEFEVFLGVVTDFLYKPLFVTGALKSQKLMAALSRSGSIGIGEGMRALTNHLFEGDARFTWGTINNYLGVSVSDVRSWLQTPLSRGYVEVTIVGDIPRDEAVDAVSRTLGSLKKRDASKGGFGLPPSPPEITAPPGFKRIEFIGEQHLALVVGTWPIEAELTVRDKAALHVLTKILELRIRAEVRDNRGLAYSPSVDFTPYNGFRGFALMQATIDCDPQLADQIAPIVAEISNDVGEHGVQESEFIGSRGILSGQVKGGFESNGFMLNLLQRAQERPKSIEEAIALKNGIIDEVTIDDVNTWANRILLKSNTRTAAIVPKPFIGIFQTSGM